MTHACERTEEFQSLVCTFCLLYDTIVGYSMTLKYEQLIIVPGPYAAAMPDLILLRLL